MAPSATHARLVAHQACVPEESCALSLGSVSDSLIEFNKPEILFWPFLLDFYFLVNNIPTTSWPYFRQGLCFTCGSPLSQYYLNPLAVCLIFSVISWRTKGLGFDYFLSDLAICLVWVFRFARNWTSLLHLSSWILTYYLADLGLSCRPWVLSKLWWLQRFCHWGVCECVHSNVNLRWWVVNIIASILPTDAWGSVPEKLHSVYVVCFSAAPRPSHFYIELFTLLPGSDPWLGYNLQDLPDHPNRLF